MSYIKKIKDLNKGELLNLIYNQMGSTLTEIHPCFCASCCEEKPDPNAYGFICKECEICSLEMDVENNQLTREEADRKIRELNDLYV